MNNKIDWTTEDISGYPGNVALYNCDRTQCIQTAGYIIDSSSKQYKVAGTGGATDISSESDYDLSDCVNGGDKTGILNKNNNKLCISSSKAVDAEPEKEYLISNVASNIFTGASATNNFIVIIEDTSIFAWNNIANGKYFFF